MFTVDEVRTVTQITYPTTYSLDSQSIICNIIDGAYIKLCFLSYCCSL